MPRNRVSQAVKDKCYAIPLVYRILKKKKDTNDLICRTETDSQILKTNFSLPKWTSWVEGWPEVWDWHIHTLVYEMTGH